MSIEVPPPERKNALGKGVIWHIGTDGDTKDFRNPMNKKLVAALILIKKILLIFPKKYSIQFF